MMEFTVEELWMTLADHCAKSCKCCQVEPMEQRDVKSLYERLGRAQEIAKEILSRS